MKKIKKFWSKLKLWQKGGIIGFIFGLIVSLGGSLLPILGLFLIFLSLLIIFIFAGLNMLSDDPWGPEGIAAIAFLLSPIFYALIGALIGLIIGKVKKK